MNHTITTRLAAIAACSAVLAGIVTVTATSASAAEVVASDVVAFDETVAAAPTSSAVPTAVASRPRTITVSNHGGRSVALFAKGERIRRVLAPGRSPVTFTGLTAGRTYTVAVGSEPIGTVVALDAPTGASGLTVRTTGTPSAVALSWRHTPTSATGGRTLAYDIVAVTPAGARVGTTVTGTRSATLTGLDPQALYAFTVTPRNSAGRGRPTTAAMSRSLAQVVGVPASAPVAEAPRPVPTATPVPTPAPAPAPAPAPRPSTRTIWVCPDGYVEKDGQCQVTMAYTFHRETETTPYTFHSEQQLNTITVPATFNGSVWTWSCPSGYDAGGGQWGVGVCKGTVTVSVKDAPPTGWYDTGSAYGHDIDVKDTMPAGYLDDGTQWVKTTAKVSREVPA